MRILIAYSMKGCPQDMLRQCLGWWRWWESGFEKPYLQTFLYYSSCKRCGAPDESVAPFQRSMKTPRIILCIDRVYGGKWYVNSIVDAMLHDTYGFIGVVDLGDILEFRSMDVVVGVRV